jgi:RNA polymerase sigma-70 factor (ECF subfamily)
MNKSEYKSEFNRLRPRLVAAARKILGDDEEAEDVVQDAMLRVWQMCEQLSPPVDSLAFVIVRNLSVSVIRRRRDTERVCDIDAPMPADEDERRRIERMMAVVEQLPDKQQMILRLRHMEGMEMSEIASLLCTTEVAVRKSLSRARMAVREKMEQNRNNSK